MSFVEKFKQIKAQQEAVATTATDYEEKGTIGGGNKFHIEEDGVYTAIVDMVIFKESTTSKACWYELTLKTEQNQKLKTNLYVINKDGLTYHIDKAGATRNNPDYSRMAGLNYILTGQWDGLPQPEMRQVMLYDYSLKAEVEKEVPIVTNMIGKPVAITVKMVLEDGYPDETVSRTVPEIRNFLDPIEHKTATELRNGLEAKVVEDFKESIAKNPNPIDKRNKSKGNKESSVQNNSSVSEQNKAPKPSFSFSR